MIIVHHSCFCTEDSERSDLIILQSASERSTITKSNLDCKTGLWRIADSPQMVSKLLSYSSISLVNRNQYQYQFQRREPIERRLMQLWFVRSAMRTYILMWMFHLTMATFSLSE